MKRVLLLLALLATTGGAFAHEVDPQALRAVRECKDATYVGLMGYGLDSVARKYLYDCLKRLGYVRKE